MHDIQQAFDLSDRVAVVTGAASGIGRAAAEVLASAGAQVLLADVDESGAEEAAAAIREAGGKAAAQAADVSRREQVDALVERATREMGGLHVMCNVAGVPADGPLGELEEEEFDRVVGVNVKGTLFGCQAALAAMAKSEAGGSIINVSTIEAYRAAPGFAVYSAAIPSEGRGRVQALPGLVSFFALLNLINKFLGMLSVFKGRYCRS